MKQILSSLILIAAIFTAPNARAESLNLGLPVECTLGTDCWTVNYVDVNPDENIHQDFRCASKTYEAHKGTDFALRSRIEMQKGVNVLAAMDARVLRVRDGEDDTIKSDAQYQVIRAQNKDCGNGVLAQNKDGVQTFYCHLKKGSIIVKPGDQIKKGQPIAKVGQSGFSEFPHLHFALIKDGEHIDPFTGLSKDKGCGNFEENHWEDEIHYEPYAVFDGGFLDSIPDFEDIKRGKKQVKMLQKNMDALIYWIGFYHGREGDEINMSITDTDGVEIAKRSIKLEKSRKRPTFYYVVKKLGGREIPSGEYTGKTTYKKEGHPSKVYTHKIIVQ